MQFISESEYCIALLVTCCITRLIHRRRFEMLLESARTSSSVSEARRLQNKLAQRRWRQRRRTEGLASQPERRAVARGTPSECGAVSTKHLRSPTHAENPYTSKDRSRPRVQEGSSNASSVSPDASPHLSLTTDPSSSTSYCMTDVSSPCKRPNTARDTRSPDREGEEPIAVHAEHVIEALALPDRADAQTDSGDGDHIATMAYRHFNPREITLSELMSLEYCAPTISRDFYMPGMHFSRAIFQNARRLGLSMRLLRDHNAVSYVGKDWPRYEKNIKRAGSPRPPNILASNTVELRNRGSVPLESPATRSSREPEIATASPPPTRDEWDKQIENQLRWDRVPNNMYPTEEQLNIEHHPYIDVAFPWPSMRSKILKCLDTVIDDNDLCDSVFKAGLPGAEQTEPAFYIWGDDAMDEASWEVGEQFARRWWFLLDDEIVRRTNWWRRRRGLAQISSQRNTSFSGSWVASSHQEGAGL